MRGAIGEREVAHEATRPGIEHRDLPARIGGRLRGGHIEEAGRRRPRWLLDTIAGGIWKLELTEDGLGGGGDEGKKRWRVCIVDDHDNPVRGIVSKLVRPAVAVGLDRVDDRAF